VATYLNVDDEATRALPEYLRGVHILVDSEIINEIYTRNYLALVDRLIRLYKWPDSVTVTLLLVVYDDICR
jgi:hypothetical protein